MDSCGDSEASSPIAWGKSAARKRKQIEIIDLSDDEGGESGEQEQQVGNNIARMIRQHGFRISKPIYPCYDQNRLHRSVIECEGCQRKYLGFASVGYKEPRFFEHCIAECIAYQESGRICWCWPCRLLFLNDEYLAVHSKTEHPHPTIAKRRASVRTANP